MRTSAAILIAMLAATPAAAFGPDLATTIRDDDRARLDQFDAVTGRTLRGAFAQGMPDDLAVLTQGLAGSTLPADQAATALPGEWSCRMLKLGGGLPLVVYQPFRCRIDANGGFEKLTGSQRMLGTIGTVDGASVYLGTGYIAGDTPARLCRPAHPHRTRGHATARPRGRHGGGRQPDTGAHPDAPADAGIGPEHPAADALIRSSGPDPDAWRR